MGRDLLTRPYGRFHYLPRYLSERGHTVHLHCLSYLNDANESTHFDGLECSSTSIYKGTAYIKNTISLIEKLQPNYIVGFSDTYFGILASWLGKKYKVHTLIDAYDNYESYIPWMLPLHWLWRHSLARADLVTAAGPGLADLLKKNRPNKPTIVIPMSADPQFNSSLDKQNCRSRLNLPTENILVGFCGGIHKNRGVKHLFQAFEIVKKSRPDIEFVISGRLFPDIRVPDYVRWLGYLDDELLPCLIRSLDVLVSVNLESAFGNYSYPVKIYEAMQSNTPVVASATPATKWILSDHQELLAPAENSQILASKIVQACAIQHIDYKYVANWEEHAITLEKLLLEQIVPEKK